MRYSILILLSLAFAFTVYGFHLSAQSPDAAQHLKDLAAANSLDAEGAKPWHLRMTFQLNDLMGKPKDSGSIEEWWVSPHERRLEIRSSSYNLTVPSSPSDPPSHTTQNRESYLVNELLGQIVHPIPSYWVYKDINITEAPRNFGKVPLSCVSVTRPSDGKPSLYSGPGQFCFDVGSSVLRAIFGEGEFVAVRNRMATFRGIQLGLDNSLVYGTKTAITGHVDTLETLHIDPSIVLTSTSEASTTVPGVVVAGHIIKKVSPVYPNFAALDHVSDTVVLCVTISKQGTISSLDVVSTTNSDLTDASIYAVKKWTYEPFLLDGSPTEINTTIMVNYKLLSSPHF